MADEKPVDFSAFLDSLPSDTSATARTGTTGGYQYNIPGAVAGQGTPPNPWETRLGRTGGLIASNVAQGAGQGVAALPELAASAGATDPVSGAVNWASRFFGGPNILPDPGATIPPLVRPGALSEGVTRFINPVRPESGLESVAADAANFAGGTLPSLLGGGAVRALAAPGSRARMTADVLAGQPVRQFGAAAAQGGVTGLASVVGGSPWEANLTGLVTGAGMAHTPGGVIPRSADAARLAAYDLAKTKYGWSNLKPAAATNSWLYRETGHAPLSGAAGDAKAVFGDYNDTVSTQIGVPHTNGKFDPTDLGDALNKTGNQIAGYYEKNPIKLIPDDPAAPHVLYDTMAKWDAKVASGELDPDVARRISKTNGSIMNRAASTGDSTLPGDWTKSQMLSDGTISSEARSNNNSTLRDYFSDLKGAIRSEFQNQAPAAAVEQFNTANNRYRDISTVADVANLNDKMVPPAALASKIDRSKYYNTRTRAPTELDTIADLGMHFVVPPPTLMQQGKTLAKHSGIGASAAALGTMALERLTEGGTDLKNAFYAALLAGGGAAGTGLLHRGLGRLSMPPTSLDYYSRLLMNPSLYQAPPAVPGQPPAPAPALPPGVDVPH